MDIILSTGNIMGAAAASAGSSGSQKSNLELTTSLRMNIEEAIRNSDPRVNGNGNGNGTSSNSPRHTYDWKRWTSLQNEGKTLFVPSVDFSESSLQEEREQYDITVKLFFLQSATVVERQKYARQALSLVLDELHMKSVDLLIVSYPGMYFDQETEDCPTKIKSRGPVEQDPEPLEAQVETWKGLEQIHDEGLVLKMGVSEFGADRLSPLLEKARIRPSVDQINLRDCCSVPKPLLTLAKANEVELLVHNDCTDILPRGTVRELLGQGEHGAGILTGQESVGEKRKSREEDKIVSGLQGEVNPQWVVKYTAVVRDRGVVENKGYFALATT